MKTIILVCGVPGVGKTFVSRKLVGAVENCYLLDSDEFWTIHGSKYNTNDEESTREAFRISYITLKTNVTKELLEKYDVVIVDGIFTRKSDRKIFYDFAEREGFAVKIIRVVCSPEVVEERIRKHTDHVCDPEDRMKGFHRASKKWEEIEREHVVIDSSKEIDIVKVVEQLGL